jgi:hypothetical protein
MITAQEPTKAAGERLAVFRTIVEGYGAATHRLGAIIVLAVIWTALASGTGDRSSAISSVSWPARL